MSLLTSWAAFTAENGLPDLYFKASLLMGRTPVSLTAKAWIADQASRVMFTAHWAF
jgi:hypothetical protein